MSVYHGLSLLSVILLAFVWESPGEQRIELSQNCC